MGADASQQLGDQLAIRELAARYNHAIDDGRAEDWVATFVPDGTFESTALGTHTGTDALRSFAASYIAAFTGRHCTSDYVVDVDGDDARSRCYLILVNNAEAPIVSTTAVYDDVLRRTSDGWRFVHRKVTPDTAIH
jgi:3-phenylpropionate/cinnamic acid dioxygenase small subunit